MYKDRLTEAMTWLGRQPDTIFIGQSIIYGGNAMFDTLEGVPIEKRIELPIMEEAQMGMSIGLALTGKVVISIYPRFDFLLLAVNQLVNHLDKLEEFTHGQFHARVIIRVGIGSRSPLYPGEQHCGDYTEAFRKILKRVEVIKLDKTVDIVPAYKAVYGLRSLGYTSLMVEDMDLYGME